MTDKKKTTYAAAAFIYLVTLLFSFYFGLKNIELQDELEQLQVEKNELQFENFQMIDEVWHLNQKLMEGEGD